MFNLDFIKNINDKMDDDNKTNKTKYKQTISTNIFYGSLKERLHIHLIKNYLDYDYANYLFKGLQKIKYNSDEDSMIKIRGLRLKIPRKQVAFGDPSTTYHFSGTDVKPIDWNTKFGQTRMAINLRELARKVGNTACCDFNYVLVNNYLNNKNSIGYHSDDERELGKFPIIAGISLGQERMIYFKSKVNDQLIKIPLPHNSLIIMHYPTNKYWKHSIPKSNKELGQRISLTYRKINII